MHVNRTLETEAKQVCLEVGKVYLRQILKSIKLETPV